LLVPETIETFALSLSLTLTFCDVLADTVAVLAEAPVIARLEQLGYTVIGSTPQELDRFVRREFEHWDRFVREYNVKFD